VFQKQSLGSSICRPGSSSSYGAPIAPAALQSRKVSRSSFQPREQELPGSTYTWSNSSHIGFHQSAPAGQVSCTYCLRLEYETEGLSVSRMTHLLILSVHQPNQLCQSRLLRPSHLLRQSIYQSVYVSMCISYRACRPFDPRSPRDDTMMPATELVTIPLLPFHEVISTW